MSAGADGTARPDSAQQKRPSSYATACGAFPRSWIKLSGDASPPMTIKGHDRYPSLARPSMTLYQGL